MNHPCSTNQLPPKRSARNFLLIALTGGIASGKSTVANMLMAPGFLMIDADQLARQALKPNSLSLTAVINHFGREYLDSTGQLNRSKMAETIFNDAESKAELEKIVHPEVKNLFQKAIETITPDTKVVIYQIPLLVESKQDLSFFDVIIAVTCDPEIACQRVMKRDSCTAEQAMNRINAQATNKERQNIANYLIKNDSSLEDLKLEVEKLVTLLQSTYNL